MSELDVCNDHKYEAYQGLTLDFDRLQCDPSYVSEVAPQLVKQLKEVGFVVVEVDKNAAEIVEKANRASREYFEGNPQHEKWRHVLKPEAVGYSHFGGKSTRQAFTVNLPGKGIPFPWPDHPDNFESNITEYFQFQQLLGSTILSTISVGRHENQDSLTKFLDDPQETNEYTSSVLFIRHYQSEIIGENLDARTVWPKDHTREHTDSGILTLKPLSEIAALQIMRLSDGKWVDAEVRNNNKNMEKFPIIILVGEELGFLTNGYFKAAIHRVAFRDTTTRVSLPFQLRGDRKTFPKIENYSPALKLIALSFH